MDNSWAVPGARCVCIDDDWTWVIRSQGYELPVRVPMLGEVLTVRSAGPRQPDAIGGDPNGIFLTFWEIDERQSDGPLTGVARWNATCFRPLQESATDISALMALLDHAPARETADG